MISAFGVEHTVSKALKSRHLAAMKRTADATEDIHDPARNYSIARLNSHAARKKGPLRAIGLDGTEQKKLAQAQVGGVRLPLRTSQQRQQALDFQRNFRRRQMKVVP